MALIVIDMQPGFEEPTHVVPVLENIRARIIQAKAESEWVRFVEYQGFGRTYKCLLTLMEEYQDWDILVKNRDSAWAALDPRLNDSRERLARHPELNMTKLPQFTLCGQNLCGCMSATVRQSHESVSITIDLSCSMCGAWFYSLHQCATTHCRESCKKRRGFWESLKYEVIERRLNEASIA